MQDLLIYNLTSQVKKHLFSVQEVQEEGKNAIDSPGSPNAPVIPPEEYELGMGL